MTIRSALWNRILSSAGLACLAMTLLLLPIGVRSVGAQAGGEALMSVDPALVSGAPAIAEQPPGVPVVTADDAHNAHEADEARRPGSPGSELQAGVIVLNTRGYNYGRAPAELDPAALGIESQTP